MEKYNGWHNFETWKVNLEFGFTDGGFEGYDASMLEDYFDDFIDDGCENKILIGILWDFAKEVNWDELAWHILKNEEMEAEENENI